jgi:hypothetical protein
MNRSMLFTIAAIATSTLSACNDASPPTALLTTDALFAKGGGGGGGGGGGATSPSRCATLVITNNPQSVRRSVMPDIKYNIENCGTAPLTVRLSIVETTGFLSELCPSPVADAVLIELATKQKLSATAPVFRGPCGTTGPVNGTPVDGINRWQGHNLLLTLTDDTTGIIYGTAPFNWQDVFAPGV